MRYRFNLVPDDFRGRGVFDRGAFFLILVLAVYISGLVGLGILYEKRHITLQSSLTQLNYQKNQLFFDEQSAKQILDRISDLQIREIRDRKILDLIGGLVGDRIHWTRTFAQLTHIVPEGAWLQSVSSTGEGPSRRMVFRGMALSNQWVARFLFFLENHPDFSDARLEFSRISKLGTQEVYSFEVTTQMTQSPGRTSNGS